MKTLIKQLEESIINLDIEAAIALSDELSQSHEVSTDTVFQAIRRALDIVGQKYEEKTYFLTELIMAGEVVTEILTHLALTDKEVSRGTMSTIVLATVRGDLHDIGKNIFGMLLKAQGFYVIDLGVDVPVTDIVTTIRDQRPEILGLSALLTTTVPEFGTIVRALDAAGLRDTIKIIVGGAAVNQAIVGQYGVDGWGRTVVEGVSLCKKWIYQGEIVSESA